jgi:hypothetical protein
MKKLLTLTVALALSAFAAQAATSHDISTGNLSITTGGEWEITGNTDTYSIKINTDDKVTNIFENVTIDGAECALDIVKGNVTLILRGSSTLHSANSAGIRVKSGTSLIIEGEGYIDVHGEGDQNSGIGSRKYENPGSITINSGHVSAYGSPFGAGIGGGGHGNGGTITINGGEIVAEGGTYAAGIGGGTGWEGGSGTITINGGHIRASSDDGAGIGCGDEGGHYTPGTIIITGGTIEASSQSGAGIGAGAKSGSSGDVPDIFISGGSIKAYADNPAASPIGPGAGHGSGQPPRTPDGQTVFLATVSGALAGHTDSYTFTTTKDGTAYTYSYTGYGHLGETNLFFYLPNGEYTVKGTNGRDFAGEINEGPGTLPRYIPASVYLHIGDGDITIEDDIGAVQYPRIVGRYGNYIIDGTTENGFVSVYTSDDPTITLDNASIAGFQVFRIEGGDVNLILNGSNSLISEAGAGLYVGPGTSVTISGTGSLTATSFGGAGAGIGGNSYENSGEIIINSGTITATGSQFAAGIGGGEHGKAHVTINGGSVTATAGWLGAGIGGGTGWQGSAGEITINGGYVKAIAGEGAGIGNGDEGGHDEIGTITITGGTIEASSSSGAGIGAGNGSNESGRVPEIYISGGSIKATSSTGSPIGPGAGEGDGPSPQTAVGGEDVYCAALTDATAPNVNSIYSTGDGEVTFTATRKSDSHSYGYEGEGHSDTYDLYFYLPEGEYTISGNNGKTYAGSVSSSGSTIAPTPEPAMFGLLALLALCLRRK